MQNISLTPLYEKKHELEKLIVRLVQKSEVEDRKFKESAEAATAVQDRITQLESTILDMTQIGEDAVLALTETVTKTIQVMEVSDACIKKTTEILQKLEYSIKNRISRLEEIKTSQNIRSMDILRENENLEIRKKDLSIYQKRIEKFYKDNDLGEVIL